MVRDEEKKKPQHNLLALLFMTNHLMIQQSISMQILINFFIFIFLNNKSVCLNTSCLPCSSHLCYQCYNTLPNDRINIEKLSIKCNTTQNFFQQRQERSYSIIQSYTITNCTMKTLYLDQYTLWNYLEYLSITYANLTRLSSAIFNRSLSSPPILYSIKTLNLSYNSVRSLNKNFSFYFPSLEKLDLSFNQLLHIRKKTFNHLIYLKELYLNNNYLKQILLNTFPSQSLYLINLNSNTWHCSCTNVLTLSISRPIPICSTPKQFQDQNASDIARQCFLRTKANLLINTNIHQKQNLTCVLSSVINEWKNKIIENLTIISVWHIEQRRAIPFEQLSALNNKSDKHLICYNFNSTYPETIATIIPLPSLISQATRNLTTIRNVISSPKLPSFFRWLLNTSKNILPKYVQKSDRRVLIVWLILLTIAFIILLILIYLIHHDQTNDEYHSKQSRSFIRFDRNLHDHRTLFNLKFTCKNHKCLCQYRRRAHSTLYLTKSISSNLHEKQPFCIQPSFIEPSQLRYAKIKRISSTKQDDHGYLTGEFRTIIKLKSLPN